MKKQKTKTQENIWDTPTEETKPVDNVRSEEAHV